jgi:hypothetical protein
MTATRDIAAGDEITFDYCTSNDWPQDWACACGAPQCRGRITGQEWRDKVRVAQAKAKLCQAVQS